jgi:hypothetical protein
MGAETVSASGVVFCGRRSERLSPEAAKCRPGTAGGGPCYPKTAGFGIFRIAAKSIAALLDPETNLILDGKPLGGCAHEL